MDWIVLQGNSRTITIHRLSGDRVFPLGNPDNPLILSPPLMKPDLVLFDFDGTIADTFSQTVEIVNRLAEKYGFRRIEEENIPSAREMNVWELMRFLHIPGHRIPTLLRKGRRQLNRSIDNVMLCDGMGELLARLNAAGVEMGIVTSNSRRNVLSFLRSHEIEGVSFVRSSSRILGKAREIRKVIRRKDLNPERVVYVGDETRDVDAAHESGIRVIAVGWGYNSVDALKARDPDYIADSPNALGDYILKPENAETATNEVG